MQTVLYRLLHCYSSPYLPTVLNEAEVSYIHRKRLTCMLKHKVDMLLSTVTPVLQI